MRRRDLLLGALAVAGGARAQLRERVRVLGYLAEERAPRNLPRRLAELGWTEESRLRMEVATARAESDAGHAAAALVKLSPDVLAAEGVPRLVALARATSIIPIVSLGISDPVGEGIARSLREPGTNVTGLSWGLNEAAELQFGFLRALLPKLQRVTFIVQGGAHRPSVAPAHEAAARRAGLALDLVQADDLGGFEAAFARIARPDSEAAWIAPLAPGLDPAEIALAAKRRHVATHAMNGELVRAGFLMTCWLSHSDPLRSAATIIDKILRGASPARIPFELPDRTDLHFNASTARALGLRLGPELTLRAQEVYP